MKKILLTILFLLIAHPSWATVYYVRTDGSNSTNCTGLANVSYDGSGTGEACAFSHPAWLLGGGDPGTATTNNMDPGDTLIFSDASEYMIGEGMPNSSACSAYGCLLNSIPAGADSANKTKVYGYGYNTGCSGFETAGGMSQLWGTERAYYVLGVASNVEIKCLEITDHSPSMSNNPDTGTIDGLPIRQVRDTFPAGLHADNGIYGVSVDTLVMERVWIHGLATHGLFTPGVGNLDFTDVTIEKNGLAGWDMDDGGGLPLTGTKVLRRVKINWSGCGERYPAPYLPHNCFSQNQGGYGDAIGIGDLTTIGAWEIYDSQFLFNVSDGLDLLHGTVPDTIKISRLYAEGNAGAAFKGQGYVTLENSMLLGNCSQWKTSPYVTFSPNNPAHAGSACDNDSVCESGENYVDCPCDINDDNEDGNVCNDVTDTGDCLGFNYCRPVAQSVIDLEAYPGIVHKIYGNTFYGNGDTIIPLGAYGSCDVDSKVEMRNNIIIAGNETNCDVDVYNCGDGPDTPAAFYTETSGCTVAGNYDEDYNLFWNTKVQAQCVGTNSVCDGMPNFTGTVPLDTSYYSGTDFISQFYLDVADTKAINKGVEGLTFFDGTADFNNFARGVSFDFGGLEYGSVVGSSTETNSNIKSGVLKGAFIQ